VQHGAELSRVAGIQGHFGHRFAPDHQSRSGGRGRIVRRFARRAGPANKAVPCCQGPVSRREAGSLVLVAVWAGRTPAHLPLAEKCW